MRMKRTFISLLIAVLSGVFSFLVATLISHSQVPYVAGVDNVAAMGKFLSRQHMVMRESGATIFFSIVAAIFLYFVNKLKSTPLVVAGSCRIIALIWMLTNNWREGWSHALNLKGAMPYSIIIILFSVVQALTFFIAIPKKK